MGWEDRQYYRDRGDSVHGPWILLFGSAPLFTVFGIRVRLHASLILCIALTILIGGLGTNNSYILSYRLQTMAILFVLVLLHEFGHCFASRWVGGDPDEIMLTPLGGLAMVDAPHRPGAQFITVAGGPLVNVLICLLAAGGMWLMAHAVAWNPLHARITGTPILWQYLVWTYGISLALLVFNLLPIFPLDGGQLLQSALWYKMGFNRSMNVACLVGIIGGAMLGLIGLIGMNLLLLLIAFSGITTCIFKLQQLKAEGPESEYAMETADYSSSLRPDAPAKKRRKASRWKLRRLRRQAEQEVAEQGRIDTILAKVSAKGMVSLTWSERRALRRATARQRQHDLEFSRRA